MDILRPIIKSFTYGFYLRRDGLAVEPYLKDLDESQFHSAEALELLQLEKLRKLLDFCSRHNGFYQRRFESTGFQPEDLKELSDLARLPILTKDDIREADDELFSEGFSSQNSVHKRTGGSTGVPLHNYWSHDAASFKCAATLRHNNWTGLVPGVRKAFLWGDTDKPQPLKARLRNLLSERAFYLDTLKFDEEHIQAFLDKIRRLRPEILMGHAHSVYRLAEYCMDHGIEGISFDGIVTSAMVLTDPERTIIEAVFHSAVFDRYGCEELSIIASECEAHQGKHICSEGLYVEDHDSSTGQPQELIITDLSNYAMPMIRYQIGDYGVFADGDCPCGRGLPRLKEVSGRTADFLYTPDRQPVFGISILDTFVIHIPGFKQMQVVQDRYDHLDFYIVKDSSYSDNSLQKLRENVIEIFGPQMRYDVHYVEQIAQTEQGKYRFSICNIDQNEDPGEAGD